MNAAAAIRLVALREVRERLRTRAYLISTGILIVLLGIGLALPKVITASSTTYRFGVVGSAPAGLTTALRRAAAPHDAQVVVHRYPARRVAMTALDNDRVDALLEATRARSCSGTRSIARWSRSHGRRSDGSNSPAGSRAPASQPTSSRAWSRRRTYMFIA